jgi:hypothetical protein
MDPNGGINPSAPKLDNTQPPTDIYAQSTDQFSGASIPPEMPATPPASLDQFQAPPSPQMPPQDVQGFGAPQAPQFQDPSAGFQQPTVDPDPMLNQPMEAPMPGGGGKSKLFMILGATIGVVLLVGGAGFAGYTMGKSAGRQKAAAEFQSQQAAAQESATETTPAADSIKLDLANTVKRSDVVEENKTGKVGEQVNSSDGLAVYVTNIERGFTPDDPSYKVEDGKELVKVNFIMGNFEDKAKDIKSADLYLLEGDKTKVLPESRLTDYQGAFSTTTINPGEQANGSIVYLVTKDAKSLTFVREQIYRLIKGSTENRVTSKISINLTD